MKRIRTQVRKVSRSTEERSEVGLSGCCCQPSSSPAFGLSPAVREVAEKSDDKKGVRNG